MEGKVNDMQVYLKLEGIQNYRLYDYWRYSNFGTLFPQHLMSLTVNSSGYLELPTHKINERETQNAKCKVPNFVS